MSSSSSNYEPDDSEDSDFSIESNRGRQRLRRSLSHHDPVGLEPSTEQEPTDQENVPIEIEDEPDSSQSRWDRLEALVQQLKPDSLDRYQGLLEEVTTDVISNRGINYEATHDTTQNGAVIWTAEEKELLFNTLDRKGKDGIRHAAATIGTKSEVEIADYLRLIQRSLEARHILEEKLELIIMSDIPSALEVSRECCAELDRYAQYLVIQEDVDTEKECRAIYADNGLICAPQAKSLVEKDVNPPLRGSIHLAANLLNVPGWTQLSTQVFMNFGGLKAEDSWDEIVKSKKESPGLYGDALMDFYALTMSITRRLVQSTMFFAMARLRSLSGIGRARRNAIRKRDVRAAVDVLNMRHDRRGFFVDAARRNHLVILDDENESPMSYEEAEEILGREDEDENSDAEQKDTASESENAEEGEEEEEEEQDDDDEEEDEVPNTDSALSQPNQEPSNHQQPDNPQPPKLSWDEIPLDAEEEHADLVDVEISRAEESKLWSILDTPVPRHLNIPIVPADEDKKDATGKPPCQRKLKEELVDWRDRTLYRSEWEEYGEGLQYLEEELVENRRKRRRLIYESEVNAAIERSWDTGHGSDEPAGEEEEIIEAPKKKTRKRRQPRKPRDPTKPIRTTSKAPLSAEIVIDDSDDESEQAVEEEATEAPIELEGNDQMDVDEPSSPAPSNNN